MPVWKSLVQGVGLRSERAVFMAFIYVADNFYDGNVEAVGSILFILVSEEHPT